jgi:hypothetical protein
MEQWERFGRRHVFWENGFKTASIYLSHRTIKPTIYRWYLEKDSRINGVCGSLKEAKYQVIAHLKG